MSRFKGLWAALIVLAAVPAAPTPASAQQSTINAQADSAQAWLADVADWGKGYEALLDSRVETLVWLMEQSEGLLNYVDKNDKTGARAWATTFASQARARLAAEMSAYQALPTEVPPFPSSVPLTSQHRARLQVLEQTPDRIGGLLLSTGESSETYIGLVEAAASGEPDDLMRLSKGIMTLVSAQLEAENVMIAALQGDPSSPNYHFAGAQIASNNALIVLMRHQQAVILSQASDAARASTQIRGHAAEARASARQMRVSVDNVERLATSDPSFASTELAGIFATIFDSMRESAAVELRMADELDALAIAVGRGDDAGVEASTLRIEGLANERIALDAARRRFLAENGG